MAGTSNTANDWSFLASGLLVCVATICVSYLVLWLWPRAHYPRLFALLAGIATVSAMSIYNVPGAGFGLGALALMAYITAHAPEAWDALFEKPQQPSSGKTGKAATAAGATSPAVSSTSASIGALGLLTLGVAIGLGVALAAVSAVVVPPAYLKTWIMHPDSLVERIKRGVEPGKEFADVLAKERSAAEVAMRAESELAILRKRATEAEAALAKAQDELGVATSNTVRSVRISEKNGSRHAGGALYVGVVTSVHTNAFCNVHVSSDKQENVQKYLYIGQAIPVLSSKGKYRVVLVGLDNNSCTFDIVKD